MEDIAKTKSSRKSCLKWIIIPSLFLLLAELIIIINTELVPEVTYTFEEHCAAYNYTTETYSVITDDGYILTLYRIPNTGSPVLFLHGLIVTSNSFILNQCTKGPAFVLADQGFDVWLGNFRGTYLSRNHTTLSIDSDEFWDFTFEELYTYDIKAFVKFIKTKSKYQKVSAIGHSMGGVLLSLGLALYPDVYTPDIGLGILFGTPPGKMNCSSYYINYICTDTMQFIFKFLGIKIYMDHIKSTFMAKLSVNFPIISQMLVREIMDFDINGGNTKDIAVYTYRNLGGINVNVLEHMRQFVYNKLENPKRYDYGDKKKNIMKYGSEEVPLIYYKNITTNVAIFNVEYDSIIPREDSLLLKSLIPSSKLVFYKDDYKIDHAGLITSCEQPQMKDVIDVIRLYES
ncbi:hypothetical protein SteCoe_13219 [Stentor coeruleus]|uniref:Partial AB-hydrolase lipase domain-containing protein n=1 Tax=Stentor coeruleus TaxID=5963 RepID=A0A1R2C8X7_9CILI|nr:hypothetical protein SteCoe_13219 [Stentor coeruleus]